MDGTCKLSGGKQLPLFFDDVPVTRVVKSPLKGADLIEVWDEIPLDIPWGAIVKVNRPFTRSVHNIGFYPARFIDQIPRWAIERYSKQEDLILDPFGGVGTTLAEALMAMRRCITLDYHPLAVLIASVKANAPDPLEYREMLDSVCRAAQHEGDEKNRYKFEAREFWFEPDVIGALSAIRAILDEQRPSPARNLLQVAFASAVRKVSNMDPGMVLAAKRARRNGPTESKGKQDVFRTFADYALDYGRRVSAYRRDLESTWGSSRWDAQVFQGDARNLQTQPADLIVTSPPYINSMDYVWATKLELYWLGMVASPRDRLQLYEREIGTERIKAAEYVKLGEVGIPEIDVCMEDIFFGKEYKASGHQNKLRARCAYRYFVDMETHFRSAYQVLKAGGYYVLVTGDNKICKVDVPTTRFLVMIAERAGFEVVHEFSVLLQNRTLNLPRNVPWSGTIKYDKVVTLRKRNFEHSVDSREGSHENRAVRTRSPHDPESRTPTRILNES